MSKYFRGSVRNHFNHMIGRTAKAEKTAPTLDNSAGEIQKPSTHDHEHTETGNLSKIKEQNLEGNKVRERCGNQSRWDVLPPQSQSADGEPSKKEETTQVEPHMDSAPSHDISSRREETGGIQFQRQVCKSDNEPLRRKGKPNLENQVSVCSIVERLRSVQQGSHSQCTINEIRETLNTLTSALPPPSEDALAALAPLPTTPPADSPSLHLTNDIPRPAGQPKYCGRGRKRKAFRKKHKLATILPLKQGFDSSTKHPQGHNLTSTKVKQCHTPSKKRNVQVVDETTPVDKRVNTADNKHRPEPRNTLVKQTTGRRIVKIKSKPQLSPQSLPSTLKIHQSPLTSPVREPIPRRLIKIKSPLNSFKAMLSKGLQQVTYSGDEKLKLREVADETGKANTGKPWTDTSDEAAVHSVRDLDLSQFFPSSHPKKSFQHIVDSDNEKLTTEMFPEAHDSSPTDTCGQVAEHHARDLDFSQFFPSSHHDIGSLIDCFEQQCVIVGPVDESAGKVTESDQAQTEWNFWDAYNYTEASDKSLLELPASYNDDSDYEHTYDTGLSPAKEAWSAEHQSTDKNVLAAGIFHCHDDSFVTTAGLSLTDQDEVGMSEESRPFEVTTTSPTTLSPLTEGKNNTLSRRITVAAKKAKKGSITNLNQREKLKALFSVRTKTKRTESTGKHEIQQSQLNSRSDDSVTVVSLAEAVHNNVLPSPQAKDSGCTLNTRNEHLKQIPRSEDRFCFEQASHSDNRVDLMSGLSDCQHSDVNRYDSRQEDEAISSKFSHKQNSVVNYYKHCSPVVKLKDSKQISPEPATNKSYIKSDTLNSTPSNPVGWSHLLPSYVQVNHDRVGVTEIEISLDVTEDKVNNNEIRPDENRLSQEHKNCPALSIFGPASPVSVQEGDAVAVDDGNEFVTTYINLNVPAKQALEICFQTVVESEDIPRDHEIEVEVSSETGGIVQSAGKVFMQRAAETCGKETSARTPTFDDAGSIVASKKNAVSFEASVHKEMDVFETPVLLEQFTDNFPHDITPRESSSGNLLSDNIDVIASETDLTLDCKKKMKDLGFEKSKLPRAPKTREETAQKDFDVEGERNPAMLMTMDVDNDAQKKTEETQETGVVPETTVVPDNFSQGGGKITHPRKNFATGVKRDTADQESVPRRQQLRYHSVPDKYDSCKETQLFVSCNSTVGLAKECSSPCPSPPRLTQWDQQNEDVPVTLHESPPKLEPMTLSRSPACSQSSPPQLVSPQPNSSQPISPQSSLQNTVSCHLNCAEHICGAKVCLTTSGDDAECCSSSASSRIGADVSNPHNQNPLVMDHSVLSSPPTLCNSDFAHVLGDSGPAAPYISEIDGNSGDVDVGIEGDIPKRTVDLARISYSHLDLLSATGTMSSPKGPSVDAQSTASESFFSVNLHENMSTVSEDSDDSLSDDANFVTSGRHSVFSPSSNRTGDEEVKMLPSLDSLLNDMKKATAEQQEMKTMHAELKNDFLYGRGIGMSGEDNETEDTDYEEFEPEQKETLLKLKLEESKILDVHPGEVVLSEHLCGHLFNEDLTPNDCGVAASTQSPFGQLFFHFQPDMLMDVLASDIIALTYDQMPCKAEVQRWLFFLLSCHRNQTVVEKCENQLLQVLQWQVEGNQKHTWAPHILDIIHIFVNWGADKQSLIFDTSAVDLTQLSAVLPMQENGLLREDPARIHRNVEALLKALSCLLQTRPHYNTGELNQLLLMVCQVSLDHSLSKEYLLYDLQVCIASILQCYEASEWDTVVPWLCRKLSTLNNHHHNQVYIAQLFSPTCRRCGYLQQRLSYSLLHGAVVGQSVSDQQILNFQIQDLCEVMPGLKQFVHTDTYRMSSLIQLLDLSVGPTAQLVAQRKQLCRLQEAVRLIVSEIRDSMQQLDCTKLKGMLLHLSLKWDLSMKANHSKQRKIFSCFQSTLVVEQLEDKGPLCSDEEVGDDAALTLSDDHGSDEGEANAASCSKRQKIKEVAMEDVEKDNSSPECRKESVVTT